MKKYVVPSGTHVLRTETIFENSGIELLVVPEWVDDVDECFFACAQMYGLKEIHLMHKNPDDFRGADCGFASDEPSGFVETVEEGDFSYMEFDFEATPLYVPAESVEAYRKHWLFEDFTQILPEYMKDPLKEGVNPYCQKTIIAQQKEGIPHDFLFFWGHHQKGTETDKSCLSQWYPCSFTVDGQTYNCAEKYMMAEKARIFRDYDTEEKILQASNPEEIKRLGRRVRNFNEFYWVVVSYDVVRRGNMAKFSQNPELLSFLLSTKGKILVEASPYDKIWGIGMKACAKANNPENWQGTNKLGFILTEVRDTLSNTPQEVKEVVAKATQEVKEVVAKPEPPKEDKGNMGSYKGIIFNSVNVELLAGELGRKVKENNIRTAVVSRKTKTECKKFLKQKGISVDVVIGGKDLDTRYKQYGKPMPDSLFVAAAKMYLKPDEVVVFGDYFNDKKAAENAGMAYQTKTEHLIPMLGTCEPLAQKSVDCSQFQVPTRGIIGAICGDVIGSAYEFHPTDDYNFEAFVKRTHVTDDSVATLAVASWLLGNRSRELLVDTFMGICNRHPNAGWGPNFKKWLRGKDRSPYGGNTNGAQMRVSACGWVANTLEETLDIARRSAEVSHNSKEGIEGAQAIAAAIFLARTGHCKPEIKDYIEKTFGYDLDKTVAEHRATRSKEYICSQSGPEAIRCWLESETYEQTIRNAVTLRTDADTVADIAGAIAAATPGMEVPQEWAVKVFDMLDDELKTIFVEFHQMLQPQKL